MTRPFEITGDPAHPGPFVFTCEHATRLLPEWTAEPRDEPILRDHWGWDVGAADLTRELVRRTRSCGILSRFSRLVCDPNRHPEQGSFVVREIDGHVLSFNRDVDVAERERRRALYHDAFHDAVDRTIRARKRQQAPLRLCSIHSFTPSYLGRARPMEIGILFDQHDEHAWQLQGALLAQGFEVALNAPYSAQDDLTYSAERHGQTHGLVYLELEVRQDLLDAWDKVRDVAARIARALAAYAPPAAGA